MNTKDYLNRINYHGDLIPDIAVLTALQENHLLNIPFENLNIHYGIPIELNVTKFYKKIIIEKRGGFCYELNGLFQRFLDDLGFESKIISARVFNAKKGNFGREYDHLAIIVKLDQMEYLVDVGFGEFAFHPLKLKTDEIQEDPRGNFMIEKENDEYIVSKINGGVKNIEYKFTSKERTLSEFQEMCTFHQTSQDSHFTQKKLICRPTIFGRITMTGNTLKITQNGEVTKNIEFPEEEYAEQLQKWFNIDELGQGTYTNPPEKYKAKP